MRISETGRTFDNFINFTTGKDALDNSKRHFKKTLLVSILALLISTGVCIGIMYLRFRVFGG